MKLTSNLRITLASLFFFGVFTVAGWHIAYAVQDWVHPTMPDVRTKPAVFAPGKNQSATGIFHGECRQPNPSQIKSQTSMLMVNKQCRFEDVSNVVTIGKTLENDNLGRTIKLFGESNLLKYTGQNRTVLYKHSFKVNCDI